RRRAAAAVAPAAGPAARHRDRLPEVPGEGPRPPLPHRRGTGRRPGALPARRAGAGPAPRGLGARLALGPAPAAGRGAGGRAGAGGRPTWVSLGRQAGEPAALAEDRAGQADASRRQAEENARELRRLLGESLSFGSFPRLDAELSRPLRRQFLRDLEARYR